MEKLFLEILCKIMPWRDRKMKNKKKFWTLVHVLLMGNIVCNICTITLHQPIYPRELLEDTV